MQKKVHGIVGQSAEHRGVLIGDRDRAYLFGTIHLLTLPEYSLLTWLHHHAVQAGLARRSGALSDRTYHRRLTEIFIIQLLATPSPLIQKPKCSQGGDSGRASQAWVLDGLSTGNFPDNPTSLGH